MNNNLYIVGIAMTGLGKFPDQSVKSMTQNAVSGALSDAGCAMPDVQAAWFSNTRQGMMEGQNTIRGQCALRSMGFSGIPIVNVENACASASTALREACAHLAAGMCDVALVAGADKMFFPDLKEETLRAFRGGADVHMIDETRAWLAGIDKSTAVALGQDVGSHKKSNHSFFMDYYAGVARLHMAQFGTTQRQIAAVAAKNHFHSTFNSLSQYQNDMTTDQVLNDVSIKWPLTRSMCAPVSDGAAAVIVCHERALERFDRSRAVRIASIALVSSSDRDVNDYNNHVGRVAALQAYETAGVGPDDIDVAEVHDACSFAEIIQSENLGFCERGAGGWLAESGATKLGGRIPINPSGGLVSKGHPVGATGIVQLHELVMQLRQEAGPRQVEGARFAAAENGGGFWGVEEAATTVSILEAPSRC